MQHLYLHMFSSLKEMLNQPGLLGEPRGNDCIGQKAMSLHPQICLNNSRATWQKYQRACSYSLSEWQIQFEKTFQIPVYQNILRYEPIDIQENKVTDLACFQYWVVEICTPEDNFTF